MTLDPAPIARLAAKLIDELEAEYGDDANLADAVLIVELDHPDASIIRWKGTTTRPTILLGLGATLAVAMSDGGDL